MRNRRRIHYSAEYLVMAVGLFLAVVFVMPLAITKAATEPTPLAAAAKATKATPDDLTKAVENGTLKRLVTTPDEFRELYGKPLRENSEQKGDGVEVLFLAYDGFGAAFQKFHANDTFGLYALNFGQGWRDLGVKGLIGGDQPAAVPDNLRKAIEDGTLKHMVTTIDEFKERFGKSRHEVSTKHDGGAEVLFVTYNDFAAAFQKNGPNDPFRLFSFNFGEGWREFGEKGLAEVKRPKEARPAGETADNEKPSSATAAAVRKAVADGTLKHLETTADEFRQLFGKPTAENTEDKRGTAQALFLAYDGVVAAFAGDSSTKEPFKLFALNFGQGWRQLGEKRLEETEERGFMTVRPVGSVKEFDDVRWKDMSKLDLSGRIGLPETLVFNEATVWPPSEKLPPGCDPKAIVEKGKNPGLGVRALHEQGVTGKGVNVAIIDQPLYQDHPEFAGKIAAYYDAGCVGSESSMHGPSVASLLVGTNCGTAPDARVYYVAAPSWTADAAFQAKALDWIVDQNAKLPDGQKIRAVSVSAAPSGPGSPFTKNNGMWDEACERAEKAGILVLTCEQTRGFIGPCWYDAQDPESVAKCRPGFPGRESGFRTGHILAPCSGRTTAEEYQKGRFSYAYWGRGGLSWSIPYATGVLALGWQVRPELSADEMKELLFESACAMEDGSNIINPGEFIRLVREAKPSSTDSEEKAAGDPK